MSFISSRLSFSPDSSFFMAMARSSSLLSRMDLSLRSIKDLSDLLNRVAFGGERVVLHRRGKNVAALVSIHHLDLLEALEDRLDVAEAKQALEEMDASGESPIPWEQVKRELELG